jgi:hypothetical protein
MGKNADDNNRQAKMNYKIRDRRNKGWFYLDNEYLNGYGKIFGAVGTAIYVSLCRHADNDTQQCFPAMELIAEENNISRNTVSKYIKLFEKHRLISVEKERDSKSKEWKSNVYTMLDKIEWLPHAQPLGMDTHAQPLTDPCTTDDKTHAQPLGNKDTHRELDSNKETHTSEASSPFIWKEYLKKMEDNSRIDINLIAYFFERRGLSFGSKAEAEVAIRRHLRAAKDASKFEKAKVFKAMDECDRMEKQKGIKWTLETVIKQMTK